MKIENVTPYPNPKKLNKIFYLNRLIKILHLNGGSTSI